MKSTFLAVMVALFGLAACGERDQVVQPQSEKRYQGKADTKPWDNAPLAAQLGGAQWKQGDQGNWEEQIKRRQLTQHEYKRIYQ
jgi:predicted small lipoprotein YifL